MTPVEFLPGVPCDSVVISVEDCDHTVQHRRSWRPVAGPKAVYQLGTAALSFFGATLTGGCLSAANRSFLRYFTFQEARHRLASAKAEGLWCLYGTVRSSSSVVPSEVFSVDQLIGQLSAVEETSELTARVVEIITRVRGRPNENRIRLRVAEVLSELTPSPTVGVLGLSVLAEITDSRLSAKTPGSSDAEDRSILEAVSELFHVPKADPSDPGSTAQERANARVWRIYLASKVVEYYLAAALTFKGTPPISQLYGMLPNVYQIAAGRLKRERVCLLHLGGSQESLIPPNMDIYRGIANTGGDGMTVVVYVVSQVAASVKSWGIPVWRFIHLGS